MKYLVHQLRENARLIKFKVRNWRKQKFSCPICGYQGPFQDIEPDTGLRKHACCPSCDALERHRIQFLVLENILSNYDASKKKILHFAPEPFFTKFLKSKFDVYESADLIMKDVDYNVDLQELPFSNGSYDFVFASHVLEHIPNDKKALQEIQRILKPEGIAILPVPLIGEQTIEYPEPNPHEAYHVRAPGFDYFDRYKPYFTKIEKYSSEKLPEKYQLFIYEDRSLFPSKECPLRAAMKGEKHTDIVPVCYV